MNEKQTPQWLQDLQESSWELEFLISGGAIFTLIQASDFLANTAHSLKITNALIGTDMLLILATLGVEILTLGFILHLALRAFWVALVCANYVYPEGIKASRIRWKRPFQVQVQEGSDLYMLILRTNKFCSTVMYLSIISSFMLAGFVLLGLAMLTFPTLLFNTEKHAFWDAYFAIFTWLWFFYILDLFLFGFFRRIPWLSYVLFPVFSLFDFVSLRFIYQRALWLYNTNVNKWQFAAAMTVFLSLAFFYSYVSLYKTLHWPNIFDQRAYRFQMAPNTSISYRHYQDELDGDKVLLAAIPSKIIDKDLLEVFMVYRKQYDLFIQESGKDYKYLSESVTISVNDSIYHQAEWFPNWKRDNDQLGLTAMLPIGHLPNGRHQVSIRSNVDTSQVLNIVFWKQKD